MNFIASTLGRFFPKHRTLAEWAKTYSLVVQAKPIQAKTKQNRASMSWRFEQARECALGAHDDADSSPASLHECRSLSARLYDAQGVDDIQTLLGHTDAAMTELYKDDRGLDRRAGKWREVAV